MAYGFSSSSSKKSTPSSFSSDRSGNTYKSSYGSKSYSPSTVKTTSSTVRATGVPAPQTKVTQLQSTKTPISQSRPSSMTVTRIRNGGSSGGGNRSPVSPARTQETIVTTQKEGPTTTIVKTTSGGTVVDRTETVRVQPPSLLTAGVQRIQSQSSKISEDVQGLPRGTLRDLERERRLQQQVDIQKQVYESRLRAAPRDDEGRAIVPAYQQPGLEKQARDITRKEIALEVARGRAGAIQSFTERAEQASKRTIGVGREEIGLAGGLAATGGTTGAGVPVSLAARYGVFGQGLREEERRKFSTGQRVTSSFVGSAIENPVETVALAGLGFGGSSAAARVAPLTIKSLGVRGATILGQGVQAAAAGVVGAKVGFQIYQSPDRAPEIVGSAAREAAALALGGQAYKLYSTRQVLPEFKIGKTTADVIQKTGSPGYSIARVETKVLADNKPYFVKAQKVSKILSRETGSQLFSSEMQASVFRSGKKVSSEVISETGLILPDDKGSRIVSLYKTSGGEKGASLFRFLTTSEGARYGGLTSTLKGDLSATLGTQKIISESGNLRYLQEGSVNVGGRTLTKQMQEFFFPKLPKASGLNVNLPSVDVLTPGSATRLTTSALPPSISTVQQSALRQVSSLVPPRTVSDPARFLPISFVKTTTAFKTVQLPVSLSRSLSLSTPREKELLYSIATPLQQAIPRSVERTIASTRTVTTPITTTTQVTTLLPSSFTTPAPFVPSVSFFPVRFKQGERYVSERPRTQSYTIPFRGSTYKPSFAGIQTGKFLTRVPKTAPGFGIRYRVRNDGLARLEKRILRGTKRVKKKRRRKK